LNSKATGGEAFVGLAREADGLDHFYELGGGQSLRFHNGADDAFVGCRFVDLKFFEVGAVEAFGF
jgi:hypothetical protein